jgi:hypothetical protein
MQVIGIRKMAVIMWCVMAIAIIMLAHVKADMPLDASDLAGLSMITALGGVHMYKQGLIDKIKNEKPNID